MKKEFLSLDHMLPGEKVVIKEIKSVGSIRRRLLDIGMIQGTPIECAFKSPFGDPTAYFVRGTLIAIRKEDAKNVVVEPLSIMENYL